MSGIEEVSMNHILMLEGVREGVVFAGVSLAIVWAVLLSLNAILTCPGLLRDRRHSDA